MARNNKPPTTIYYRTAQQGGMTSGIFTGSAAGPTLTSVSGFTPCYVGEYRLVRTLHVTAGDRPLFVEEVEAANDRP